MIPFSLKNLNSEFIKQNSDIRATDISLISETYECNKLRFDISEKYEYLYVNIDGDILISYVDSLRNIHTLVRELIKLNLHHETYYTNKNTWVKNFYSKLDNAIPNYSLDGRYYIIKRGSVYRNYYVISINIPFISNLYITIDLHDKIIKIRKGNILSTEHVTPLNLLYRYDVLDDSEGDKVCDEIIKAIKYFMRPTLVNYNNIINIAFRSYTYDLSISKIFGDNLINRSLYYLYDPYYFENIILLDFTNSMELYVLYSSNPNNNPSIVKIKTIPGYNIRHCYKIYNSKTLDSLMNTINNYIFGSKVDEVNRICSNLDSILKRYNNIKNTNIIVDDLENFIELDEITNIVTAHSSYIIKYPGNIKLILEVVVSKDDEYCYIECEEVSDKVKVPIVDDLFNICSNYILSRFHYLQECTINVI